MQIVQAFILHCTGAFVHEVAGVLYLWKGYYVADRASAQQQHYDSVGFLLLDYWGYIPNVEACVCLSNMGDYKRAYEYNERAGKIKPHDAAVLHNRAFLQAFYAYE